MTLLEAVLVVSLVVLLLGPIYQVFHHGTRASLRGMLHVETSMEAMRVLRQVSDDLRDSCLPMDEQGFTLDFSKMLGTDGVPPLQSYTFLRFPQHGSPDQVMQFARQGKASRRASRITYRLEPLSKAGLKHRLIRTERFHPEHPLASTYPGGERISILSERVHSFILLPDSARSGNRELHFFWVTLQMVDSLSPADEERILQRREQAAIGDYFDVVYPEFFNAFQNRGFFNRNWHTGISAP